MFALKKACILVPKTTTSSLCRYISWTSKTVDNTIDLTFITPKGESKTVKARIGDRVLDTAEEYGLPICGDCHGRGLPVIEKRTKNWSEEVFGEGPQCNFCHVVLSRELFDIVPKARAEEQEWIDKITLQKNAKSRLSCQIVVTKDMDGGVIHIPDHLPNKLY